MIDLKLFFFTITHLVNTITQEFQMLLLHLQLRLKDLMFLFQYDKFVRNQAADFRKNEFKFFKQLLFFQNSCLFIQLFLVSFLIRNLFLCFSQVLPKYFYLVIVFSCCLNVYVIIFRQKKKHSNIVNVRLFTVSYGLVDLLRPQLFDKEPSYGRR